MSFALASISWPRVPVRPLVLLPIGSTEQHGPHLPFGTDTVVATAVADGVAARLIRDATVPDPAMASDPASAHGSPVLVAPSLPYGASGEHQAFPGTVSIGHEALRLVLIECVRSLSTWAGRIVVVNGHGGNVATLRRAIPQLIEEGHRVAWAPCVPPGTDAHAGRTETSLMIRLAAENVDLVAAAPGNTMPLHTLLPILQEKGVRSISESGILGDPSGANEREGGSLLEAMIDDVFRRVVDDGVDELGCLR